MCFMVVTLLILFLLGKRSHFWPISTPTAIRMGGRRIHAGDEKEGLRGTPQKGENLE